MNISHNVSFLDRAFANKVETCWNKFKISVTLWS